MDNPDSSASAREANKHMLQITRESQNPVPGLIDTRRGLFSQNTDGLGLFKNGLRLLDGDAVLDKVLGSISQVPLKGEITLAFYPIH